MTASNRVNLAGLTVVVMAKPAVPARVKTRLMPDLDAQQAAEVHQAMLTCVLTRLEGCRPDRQILAMNDGEDCGAWQAMPQGEGDLGKRIKQVWEQIGGGPAVFFGVDSPDVPAEAVAAIPGALKSHDAAIGPVDDGGYWCLAARKLEPALLAGIDWGGDSVYDQTLSAAANAGVDFTALPPWHDVDDAADLQALQLRLQWTQDPALRHLADRLSALLQE